MEEQRQHQLHSGVLDGIARLDDPRYREERHKLIVHGFDKPPIDRQSLQHLVNYLDGGDSHEVVISELELESIRLNEPSEGGLEVLREFFARRSDSTLTKVTLRFCKLGSQDDATRLLAAFHTNRTVTDLQISGVRNLRGAAFGNFLSSLMQNMPQLQRLDCYYCDLRVEGVRAFQPALQANRTLRELHLSQNGIGDDGIRLIADAMVGNTTMEVLDIGWNGITRSGAATYANINNSLTRNQQLNRVNLLLAPPPPPPPPQQQRNSGTMMLKIWHKAIAKFAMVPNNAGASAMFKLFQARPALLEKRIKQRPAATSSRLQEDSFSHDAGNDSKGGTTTTIGGQKRRRL